ncbi:LysR family transcriptional regulator [Caulobacter sp. CCNWLY153]|uniref:LysR family transcriptional regulator n=1 Tax=Caulobacter radicis TaxID=2172650 RepID=A0A2T9JM80_9CAUL|nr:LysR family transcriptional regulator [Caulobacter radicis]PVM84776.1 LysR family transcriptional regulator [Caulobacter radicis]
MDPHIQGQEYAQLRAFVAVAQLASFSRAAEQLGISPSALSQTIRLLEERLGVRLLNRTTRSVAPTPAGGALLARLAPAMGEIAAAVGAVGRFRSAAAGTVRLHSSRLASAVFVEPMLASFHAAYPDIVLDLTIDDAVVDMVAGGYDAAIRPGEVIEKDLIAVRIGPDHRQLAAASPAYLAAHGAPEAPADLHQHHCLRWRWSGRATPYNWEFYKDGAWFEVAVDGPLIVNERSAMLRAAIDGLGIGFFTSLELAGPVSEGRLTPLLEAWTHPYPGYAICYPRQRQMAPALRAFIDALRAFADQ